MALTIEVESAHADTDEYPLVIMVSQILYLDKENVSNISRIHLVTREMLYSKDSLKTIKARIDATEKE